MKEFAGRTAVVTGGASGIGRALADRFADAHMNVVLADIEEGPLEKAVAELEERQARVIGVKTNTMVRQSVEDLAARAIGEFGKVHILCNNAGVASSQGAGKAIWEVPDKDWDWVMGVNFYGVLYGLQAFVPHMLEHGEEGHIMNTASLAGLLPAGGTYGVSKHGVLVLSESLQADLASRGANIHASVLCPGFVDTRIFAAERNRQGASADDNAGGAPTAEQQEMMQSVAKDLLSKGKAPSEIAEAVFDAISREQFYILPHPAWDNTVRGRVEAVLARGTVAGFDMAELLTRRESGEQL